MFWIVGVFDALQQGEWQVRLGRRGSTAVVENAVSCAGDELNGTKALERLDEARWQDGEAVRWKRVRHIPEKLLVIQVRGHVQAEGGSFRDLPVHLFASARQAKHD